MQTINTGKHMCMYIVVDGRDVAPEGYGTYAILVGVGEEVEI